MKKFNDILRKMLALGLILAAVGAAYFMRHKQARDEWIISWSMAPEWKCDQAFLGGNE